MLVDKPKMINPTIIISCTMTTMLTTKKKISILASIAMAALVIVSASVSMTMAQQANLSVPTFGNIVNVSGTSVGDMAVSGNNMHVIWQRSKVVDGNVLGSDVFFKTVKDSGISSPPIKLTDNNAKSQNAEIVSSGNNVYVTWLEAESIPADTNTTPKFDIFIKKSNDNGLTFSDAINLSNTGSVHWMYEVVTSGSNVYTAWVDTSNGNWDVFFRSSNDNGATWSPVINLSNNAGMSAIQGSSITISGSYVYVVWQDNSNGKLDILFRASNDNGATFGPTVNLGEKGISYRPAVAASGNNVYVAGLNDPTPADDSQGPELNIVASRDNGRSFGSAVNISSGQADYPKLAAVGNNVYVAWQEFDDYTSISRTILFRASNDNGASFGPAINLSNTIQSQTGHQITASANTVLVLWSVQGNILFKVSNDNGASFGHAVNLSNGQSLGGGIMEVDDGKVYVAWNSKDGMSFRVGI